MSSYRIEWQEMTEDYQTFSVRGVPFRLVRKNFSAYRTDDTRITILKDRHFLQSEIRYFDYAKPKSMVEIGLYEGGSAILWHLLYDLKFIGFDLRKQSDAVLGWLKRLGIENDVSLYFETSQEDETKIRWQIGQFLGDTPVDIIIDDASHQYAPSRRTFEFLFPLLRAGGIYCLEDWSWAHGTTWAHANSAQWQVSENLRSSPALTNLVFEITMLLGSRGEWFQQISLTQFAAFIFSSGRAPKTGISFDRDIVMPGRTFAPI